MMQSSAPAPGAPSPWDSGLGAIEDSISQCTFLQMTYTAEITTQTSVNTIANTALQHKLSRYVDTSMSLAQNGIYGIGVLMTVTNDHIINDLI
jgi:hypothetical protein